MKNKKLSKKFEKLFNYYDNDEFKIMLEEELIKNIKYYKSSMDAKEILSQFNIPYFGMNKFHYYILNQLTILCDKYHIYVNKNIDVSIIDVIERLKENLSVQEKLYKKYQYDLSTNNVSSQNDNILSVEELNNIYNSIIEKLMEDNEKVLVKKYE